MTSIAENLLDTSLFLPLLTHKQSSASAQQHLHALRATQQQCVLLWSVSGNRLLTDSVTFALQTILCSSPAICWLYRAGIVFISCGSLVFWGQSVARLCEKASRLGCSVQLSASYTGQASYPLPCDHLSYMPAVSRLTQQ